MMSEAMDAIPTDAQERATAFQCHDAWLYGVLSLPPRPAARGVLVVVGGPQYRAGSHRQFALMARALAAQGIPVFRFDYRGMGDSDGMMRSFENVGDDIRAAIDHFFRQVPSVREIVLWGLCDGASASLFYASGDARVRGLVLLNPWVRTEQSGARAYLKHYYTRRLFDAELWTKIFRGHFDYRAAAQSVLELTGRTMRKTRSVPGDGVPSSSSTELAEHDRLPTASSISLPERMLRGLTSFQGRVLVILSGNDLTAQEFSDLAAGSRAWKRAINSPRIRQQRLEAANHTFSQRDWRDQVTAWTGEWVRSW